MFKKIIYFNSIDDILIFFYKKQKDNNITKIQFIKIN